MEPPTLPPAVPRSKSPSPPPQPSNDDIEAVIQMATSAGHTPDGRSIPIKDTRTQLFVGNLPYRVRWQDLKDLFRRSGTVLRADVSLGPDNRSRGYGTVLLATAEDAGRAIDMFHGYSWQTRILEVRPDRLPQDLDNPLPALPPNTHSIPIPFSASSSASPLTSAAHLTSPCRTARILSDDLDFTAPFGSEANNASSSACRNLFVGNLPFHCQWQDLKDLFRQAGTVIRADVALGLDGRSRGFGMVVYTADQDAERAVKMFNGYEFNGRTLKVHFDRYTPLTLLPASPTHPNFHQAMSAANVLQPPFHTTMSAGPNHINPPMGYYPDILPSGPSSPYDLYHTSVPIFSCLSPTQQQIPIPPLPQSQPHELFSQQDCDMRSPNDTESTAVKFASTLISPHSDSASPIWSHQTAQSDINRSIVTTSEDSLNGNTNPTNQSQSHSQNQKFNLSPTTPPQGQHPHHPGPISLPPPTLPFLAPPMASPLHHPAVPISLSPLSHPNLGSPLHHPSFYASHSQMTPHGLPPMTPSMPPFIFHPVPPSASPNAATTTHTSSSHMPMFGSSFSPTVAMSPGTFWGRPGHQNPNPFINPAVGAPVHMHSSDVSRENPGTGTMINSDDSVDSCTTGASPELESNLNVGGSAYFYPPPGRVEPTGYFDPVYLPGSSHSAGDLGPSGLANEIKREKSDKPGRNGIHMCEDVPSTNTSPTNAEDADDLIGRSISQESNSNTTSTLSEATSWYSNEDSGDDQTAKAREFRYATSSLCLDGKNTGSKSADATTTVNGSDAEPRNGVTGSGFLIGERRIISRTHSMSSGSKPLFLTSFQFGLNSGPSTDGSG